MNEISTSCKVALPPTYRKASLEDAVFVARLIREFYHKSGGIYGIGYDHDSTLVTIQDIIDRGILLVGDTSCAGAIISAFPFNNQASIAWVVFWYFRNKREIGIFKELIEQCRQAGATHINTSSHFPNNTVGRFYHKCGLASCEIQYLAPLYAHKTACEPAAEAVKEATA